MRAARPEDWETEPLPERRTAIVLDRTYTGEEMEKIRKGLVPEVMEDKWFIYWKDGKLFFHRSWTGFCIYVVRFAEQDGLWRMVQAEVNRDPGQYRETSDERDAEMIPFLVDALLLRRPVGSPGEKPAAGAVLSMWSSIGRAMLGQHPAREDAAEGEAGEGGDTDRS